MFKNNVCSGHCTNKTELDLADRRKNKTCVNIYRNMSFTLKNPTWSNG